MPSTHPRPRSHTRWLGAWLLLFLGMAAAVPGQEIFRFETVSALNPAPESFVFDFLQDRQGYLWMATMYGLVRYDGNRFTTYGPRQGDPASLSDGDVRCLLQDQGGYIWAGVSHGCLERFDPRGGTFRHFFLEGGGPASRDLFIQCMLIDRRQRMWIGTDLLGLNLFDRQKGTFQRVPLPETDIHGLLEDRDGALWVATERGLYRYQPENGAYTVFRHDPARPDTPSGDRITGIVQDKAGHLWLTAFGGGLNRMSPDGKGGYTFTRFPQNPGAPDTPSGGRLVSLFQDRRGRLWLGSEGEGLTVFDPAVGVFRHFQRDPELRYSLSSNNVLRVFEDAEGVYWIGGDSGFNKLAPGNIRFRLVQKNADPRRGLLENSIDTVYKDRQGRVWIATAGGWLSCWRRPEETFVHTAYPGGPGGAPPERYISAVCQDEQGRLWLGTGEGRIVEYDPERGRFVLPGWAAPQAGMHSVFLLLADRRGGVWGLIYKYGVVHLDTVRNRLTVYRHRPDDPASLADERVVTMALAPDGNLWIGTESGLEILDPGSGRFRHASREPAMQAGIHDSPIMSIHFAADGAVWLVTTHGLRRFDPVHKTMPNYSKLWNLPPSISTLVADRGGWFWMASDTVGLLRIDPRNGRQVQYGVENGLQGLRINYYSAMCAADGELLFSGDNGLNTIHPQSIPSGPATMPLVFTTVRNGRGDVLAAAHGNSLESVRVKKTDLPLTVEFSALTFAQPQKCRYAVRWSDGPAEWRAPDRPAALTLHALSLGKQTLHLKAADAEGRWTERAAVLQITVGDPRIYVWIVLGFLLLAAAGSIAYLVHRYRHPPQATTLAIRELETLEPVFERYKISKREREILLLVLQGKTNHQIEEILFISLETVKTHLYKIYKKLGVKSRLQLISLMAQEQKKGKA